MAFTHTTTDATNRSSIYRGDVGLVSGTWRGSNVNTGTINTGGSVVLFHDLLVGSAYTGSAHPGTFGSAQVFSQKNETGGGDSKNGMIRVSAIDASHEVTGQWLAVVIV